MKRKYFPNGMFTEAELRQYGPRRHVQQSAAPQGYHQRLSAVIDTTHSGIGAGSSSVTSEGSYPSCSATPSTPQGQYWNVPIQGNDSNEPQQWVNLAQYPSKYHGEMEYNQSVYGSY